MTNRYDWGIYSGIKGIPWDRTEKEVNVRTNVLYMLNRSLGMFRYTGLPDTIKAYDLERLLQTNGYGVVTKDDKGDLYAFYGGLGGMYNAYGQPTQATISNPWLKFNKTVDLMSDEAVLLRSDFMMMGLVPIYSKYSTLMVENEITMVLAGYTKRVNHIISANDDNTSDSARNFLKKVEDGEVGFITETKLFDSLKTNPFGGGNANLNELIEMQQYLKASMYNEIGLDANFNMKRERLNSAEVEMNSDALYPLIDQMLQSRRDGLDEINSTFGTNITVEFNSSWDYRINQGEPINTEGAGMGDLQSSVPVIHDDEEQGIENIIDEGEEQDATNDGVQGEPSNEDNDDEQSTGEDGTDRTVQQDSDDTTSDGDKETSDDEDTDTDDDGTDEQGTDEDSRDSVDEEDEQSDDESDENEDAAKDETEDKEDESDDEEEDDDKEDKK